LGFTIYGNSPKRLSWLETARYSGVTCAQPLKFEKVMGYFRRLDRGGR
jgi:hypothetical protein